MKKITSLYVRPEDERYIEEMKNQYASKEEALFFEVMNHKIHHEPALSNDLIMDESNNEDGLYILRLYDSEFVIGRHQGENFAEEVHAMTFQEAMTTNLKDANVLEEDITLIEWLRRRAFKGIEYDHNFDMM